MGRKWLVRSLVVLVAGLGADQLLQFTALRDGKLGTRWVIPFDPPLFIDAQRDSLGTAAAIAAGDDRLRADSLLDADLGWCPRPGMVRDHDLYAFDWAGCRVQIAPLGPEKVAGVRRVVAVGCSFTQGAEVAGSETWSAQLDARHEDLEVANLGVAGYGVDQALLRFRRDGSVLAPDEVWLGFLPEGALRITTQYPPAYQHWSQILEFKPCFVLDESGALELHPSPVRDHANLCALLGDTQAFLAATSADRWVRRMPVAFAPRGSSWLHHFACTRLVVSWLEAGGREPAPHLGNPADDVHRLMRALVLQLATEARAAGAKFRLLVLPSRPDLQSVRTAGGAYWGLLLEELGRDGIECIDTTRALMAAGLDSDARAWMPLGHYSPAGNRIVADALAAALGL